METRAGVVDVSGFDLSSIPLFITIPQLHETVIRTQFASGRELTTHSTPGSRSRTWGNWPAVGLQGEASCEDQNRSSKFKPSLEALGARGLWALGWLSSRGPFPWPGPPPSSLPISRSGNCFVSGSESRFPPKEILSHRSEAGSGLEFPCRGETPPSEPLREGTRLEPACANPEGTRPETHTHVNRNRNREARKTLWGPSGAGPGFSSQLCLHLTVRRRERVSP